MKLEANTAITPKPITLENFALNEVSINAICSLNLVCPVDQIAIDAIGEEYFLVPADHDLFPFLHAQAQQT